LIYRIYFTVAALFCYQQQCYYLTFLAPHSCTATILFGTTSEVLKTYEVLKVSDRAIQRSFVPGMTNKITIRRFPNYQGSCSNDFDLSC
jgi:hypothetical protein